jgi:serine/threonine protein kinase
MPRADSPTAMTGQTLGHYRVFEEIGSGGMGEVYRASDDRLGRDVALKVLKPSLANDQDRLRRFEQEARAAAALSHPNIVAIYDIGMHAGAAFIVSELLEGQTLRQRLFDGPLSLRQAVDYGIQIAKGLVAAHEKRIVHRDLKPENLFITRGDGVKILDFGIAKLTAPELGEDRSLATMTTQTKSGSVLGTVAYMSPEQLRGRPVDHRSDIFSFGAVLYEMLTGKRAFSGETQVDTMTAVLKEEPPEITLTRQSIPTAFEQIVRHCLEKEPENRFQSCTGLGIRVEHSIQHIYQQANRGLRHGEVTSP